MDDACILRGTVTNESPRELTKLAPPHSFHRTPTSSRRDYWGSARRRCLQFATVTGSLGRRRAARAYRISCKRVRAQSLGPLAHYKRRPLLSAGVTTPRAEPSTRSGSLGRISRRGPRGSQVLSFHVPNTAPRPFSRVPTPLTPGDTLSPIRVLQTDGHGRRDAADPFFF